ncbi:MAG: 50S ribosomal protein L29 [Rickettsiaceae bacterium]|nr:50S ribosomal protein L29 [Rickettsiaceae bacterium]
MSKKKNDKKAVDIINQTVSELRDRLLWLKKELFNLRFQKTVGELTNTSRFRVIRRDVARVQTELVKRSRLGDK